MLTQSHVAIGLLVAARSGRRAAIFGAIVGGITPDFFMLPMFLIARFVLGQDMTQIWDETFYAAPWWTIDQIANSAPLYALLLIAGLAGGQRWHSHALPRFVTAFALTGLLHVAFDFLTHSSDGHAHFWPVSDFVFASPVSYWEAAHFGRAFGLVEALGGLVAAGVLWWLYRGWQVRTFCGVLLVLSLLGLLITALFSFGVWESPSTDRL